MYIVFENNYVSFKTHVAVNFMLQGPSSASRSHYQPKWYSCL